MNTLGGQAGEPSEFADMIDNFEGVAPMQVGEVYTLLHIEGTGEKNKNPKTKEVCLNDTYEILEAGLLEYAGLCTKCGYLSIGLAL